MRTASAAFQPGAGDSGGELYCLVGRHELVIAAVQDKCGHGDLAEQIRQLIADGGVLQGDGGLGGRRHDEQIGEGIDVARIAAPGGNRGDGSRRDRPVGQDQLAQGSPGVPAGQRRRPGPVEDEMGHPAGLAHRIGDRQRSAVGWPEQRKPAELEVVGEFGQDLDVPLRREVGAIAVRQPCTPPVVSDHGMGFGQQVVEGLVTRQRHLARQVAGPGRQDDKRGAVPLHGERDPSAPARLNEAHVKRHGTSLSRRPASARDDDRALASKGARSFVGQAGPDSVQVAHIRIAPRMSRTVNRPEPQIPRIRCRLWASADDEPAADEAHKTARSVPRQPLAGRHL